MRELTEQEKEELAQHKLWLDTNAKQGKRLNWFNRDLRGVNLEGANLKEADFRYTNLSGANLKEATLEGVNLEGAWVSFAIKILGNIYIIKSYKYSITQQIVEYRLATPMEIGLYS